MALYLISTGVAINGDLSPEAAAEDRAARVHEAVRVVFSLGPAWSGGQNAILLRSDLGLEDVTRRVLDVLLEPDLALVLELPPGTRAAFGGSRFDDDNFDALLPNAVELPHVNTLPAGRIPLTPGSLRQ